MNDFTFGLRQLRKHPGFALIAITTLGLGIGVNTAMFSILDAIMLRGLPSPEQHRLVAFYYMHPGDNSGDRLGVSQLEFDELRASQQSFIDLAASEERTATLQPPGGDPERINGTAISATGPAMLAAPLAFGRWFTASEDKPGAAPTVVLSHALWQSRFKGDPAVLGTSVKMNSEWTTVIGVAAKGFGFPERAEAFYPPRGLHLDEKRDARPYQLFGRLKPGVTLAQARAEFTALGQRITADHPEAGTNLVPQVKMLKDIFSGDETRLLLKVMLAAVFFVLLIACGNVANLLLARAAVRQKEMAVRSALGASRRQIIRLLLAESFVLVVIGCLFGLGVAWLGMALFRDYAQNLNPPYWMDFRLDGVALLYTAGLAIAACLLAGLYPALRLSRPDLNTMLNDAARGSTSHGLARFTRWMVIGEVALSCLLLVLSALTIRSVIKTYTAPLGFSTAGIYTGRVSLPDVTYKAVARQREFSVQLSERLRERPEIASFALCDLEVTWTNQSTIAIDGRTPVPKGERGSTASIRAISPGYLETLGITLQRGRNIDETDTADSPRVALVSNAFAEKYWPGENAVGKRIRQDSGNPTDEMRWLTVVGVTASTMQGRFDTAAAPQMYMPFTQSDELQRMTIFAKARGGDPVALAPVLRSVVRGINEDLPVYFARSLEQSMVEAKYDKKLIAGLFAVFGVVAFVLSAVGLYGVMSYNVTQRRQEIGVRVALGATPRHILRMMLGQGGWQLGLGLAIGLTLSAFAGQLLATVLYGVTPRDAASFGATVLALGAAGFLATIIPALRAIRIDPAVVLRAD